MKIKALATCATLFVSGMMSQGVQAQDISADLPLPAVAEPGNEMQSTMTEEEKTGCYYPCYYRPYRPAWNYPVTPCGVNPCGVGNYYGGYYPQPSYNYGYGSFGVNVGVGVGLGVGYGNQVAPAYSPNPYGYGVSPINYQVGYPNYPPVMQYPGVYGENDVQTQSVNDPFYP